MAYEKLISMERCHRGAGTFVEHNGRELAVFLLDKPERVVVIDNACPHASGNLSGGEIDGEEVVCPWHYWRFDLNTGVCTESPRARVRTYRAKLKSGLVWIDLDAGEV